MAATFLISPIRKVDNMFRTSPKGELAKCNTATSVIVTPTYTSAVSSLAQLLTLIFVVILIIMAVRSIEA